MDQKLNHINPQIESNGEGTLFTTAVEVKAESASSIQIQCNMVDGYAEAYKQDDSEICFIKVISKGVEPLKRMMGFTPNSVVDLLLKAVNNRTIERNYFRLYGELSDGIITEEEFNKEIEENENDYVLCGEDDPNEQVLNLALSLSQYIKDVNDTEDLSSLFSINSAKLDAFVNKLDAYDSLRKCK